MKARKGLLIVLAMLMLTAALPLTALAMNTKKVSSPEPAEITLFPRTLTLEVGETYRLKVSGTSKKVTWKSSKKKVASVTSKGRVTAKKVGTATISAKVAGKTLKCKVRVVEEQGVWVVQAGVYNWQYNLARQFIRVRDYVSDAYWTHNDGVYTIIAGTFYDRGYAVARRNYLLNNGINASVEYR